MNKLKIILGFLIANIVFSFFLLSAIGKKLNPILSRYVNTEANRFANNIVNSTVNEIIAENYETDLFYIKQNASGEIEMLDYNTQNVNKILMKVTDEIKEKLTNLEDGKIKELEISSNFKLKNMESVKKGVLCEVPIGALSGNTLFSNIGPNIPIKLSFIGQVQSSLETKLTSYGINNVVMETNIIVKVEEQVTMPTSSEKSTITITAPLSIKLIKGSIPDYYLQGLEKQSTILSK